MLRTFSLALRREWSGRWDVEQFLESWRGVMHDDTTWPRGGAYQCRTCGRSYPVPRAEPEHLRPAAPSIPAGAPLDHARTA